MNPFEQGKLAKHLDRVAAWQAGEIPAPVTMEFDLTGRCNHHCSACCGGYRSGDMLPDDARDWLSQMAAYGVRGVMFTGGGEPFLHPQAVDLVEHAAESGMDVGLITNGTLLTVGQADRLVEMCEWVRVSIDAGDAETYQAIHGVGPDEWRRAWGAVEALAQARDRWGAACTVGIGYLVSDATAGGVLAAHQRANDSGADYLQLRPFLGEAAPLSPDLLRLLGRCRVVCSEAKYAAMDGARSYATCHGAWFTGVVQADGSMPVCCHGRGGTYWSFGNLHVSGFREAWESQEHRRAIEAVELARCPTMCRNDGISAWLEATLRPVYHESFI